MSDEKRKPLYDVTEVANWLGMHPETVRRKARAGKIEAIRLDSGEYRFTHDAVESYLHPDPETA